MHFRESNVLVFPNYQTCKQGLWIRYSQKKLIPNAAFYLKICTHSVKLSLNDNNNLYRVKMID